VTPIDHHFIGRQALLSILPPSIGEMRQNHTTVLLIDDEASQPNFVRRSQGLRPRKSSDGDRQPGLSAGFMSSLGGAEVCRLYGIATTDLHFREKTSTGAELLPKVRRVLEFEGPFLTRTAS